MFTVDQIARVVHEANRALQLAVGDPAPSPMWEDAPDWQRTSAVEGVEAAIHGQSPRESHETWMAGKVRDGWRYGPVKDAGAKTHPALVAYEDLPADQVARDHLFVAVVQALAA
jgi:hypothetical protein